MTNYNAWDSKADLLVKEAEKEEEEEKKASDEALGLQDGPQGPPVARAKEQREDMSGHGENRKNFIAAQQAKEVVLTHADATEPIVISAEQASEKALRLRGSQNVTYKFPKEITMLKLFVEQCKNVKVKLGSQLKTSFLEINHCSDVEVVAEFPVSTVQCDECTDGYVRIIFKEPENVGTFFHQNSPALEVAVEGQEPKKLGSTGSRQQFSRAGSDGTFHTIDVVRGEKEFPICLVKPTGNDGDELEAETLAVSEEARQKAEAKRAEGNEAFKANDFLQAAVFYTEAIQFCPELHLAWANRAQCFLKTGQPERALSDAVKCTELVPDYAKGWFRKGMALHALERYGAAIPAFVEAEKLDPKNPQIPEDIRMAQFKCREKGPGDNN